MTTKRGLLAVVGVLSLLACGGEKRLKKVLEACSDDQECESGICFESVCLDPDVDDDGDGLRNGLEYWELGTNPKKKDTDDDGKLDMEEVGSIQAPNDADGDTLIDAVESALADADQDCLPDQYDARNNVPDTNVERQIARIHCLKNGGICLEQEQNIHAACVGGEAKCDYKDVKEYQEIETLCDAKDNDCDGETDKGLTSQTEGECSERGVCGAVQITRLCINGSWVCDYQSVPGWEHEESSFDGKDNDCDGETDEGMAGMPCVIENEHGKCIGQQAFREGEVVCDGPVPKAETCDGTDNDCDGKTDEDIEEKPDGKCKMEGVCKNVLLKCIGGELVCDYASVPAFEVEEQSCDGMDNDCDGRTDEGLAGEPCQIQNEFGMCSGFTQCQSGKVFCGAPSPHPEECNNADDNCDGQTDEGGVCSKKVVVRGYVRDGHDLKPVVGALVEIQGGVKSGSGNGALAGTKTDENGAFSIVLEPGIFWAVVSAEGYEPLTTWSFVLGEGETLPLEVTLTRAEHIPWFVNICGRVTEAATTTIPKPLEGATVTVFGDTLSNPLASASSGPQGFFCVSGVSGVNLQGSGFESTHIVATKPGYRRNGITVSSTFGEVIFAEIALAPLPQNVTILLFEDFESKTMWTPDAPQNGVGWVWVGKDGYTNNAVGICVLPCAVGENCEPDPSDPTCAICADPDEPGCIPALGSLPRPVSGNGAMWFGNPKTGNYLSDSPDCQPLNGGIGKPVSGSLRSPWFVVEPNSYQVLIGFYSAWEVESNWLAGKEAEVFDEMLIKLRSGENNLITVGRLNPSMLIQTTAAQPLTSAGFNRAPIWAYYVFDVTGYIGYANNQLEFEFNSKDGRFNGFRGWMIDRVEIIAVPLTTTP